MDDPQVTQSDRARELLAAEFEASSQVSALSTVAGRILAGQEEGCDIMIPSGVALRAIERALSLSGERDAIVEWLRKGWNEPSGIGAVLREVAERVERGDHLKTKGGR